MRETMCAGGFSGVIPVSAATTSSHDRIGTVIVKRALVAGMQAYRSGAGSAGDALVSRRLVQRAQGRATRAVESSSVVYSSPIVRCDVRFTVTLRSVPGMRSPAAPVGHVGQAGAGDGRPCHPSRRVLILLPQEPADVGFHLVTVCRKRLACLRGTLGVFCTARAVSACALGRESAGRARG